MPKWIGSQEMILVDSLPTVVYQLKSYRLKCSVYILSGQIALTFAIKERSFFKRYRRENRAVSRCYKMK